ncbi:hypothetical protein P7C70_g1692, partial [Phenoliferia sp. Uapishka_3]
MPAPDASQLTVPSPSHRLALSSLTPLLFSPLHEPYLPIPSSPYILTPARLSDPPVRVTLLNDPTVSPYLFSPPNPYTLVDAVERTKENMTEEQAMLMKWAIARDAGEGVEARLDGCPLGVIREVEDGEEAFVGEFGFGREDAFMEIVDMAEREGVIRKNLEREAGDPLIVWTMFFLLLPEHAGKGVMTRVFSHLFDAYLIPVLNVRHVLSYAFCGNEGSKRVHEKLKFKLIGTDWLEMREDRGGGKKEEWIFEWKLPVT